MSTKTKGIIPDSKVMTLLYDPELANQEMRTRLKKAVDERPLPELAQFIDTEIKGLTKITSFNYKFTCFLEDGAYALYRAIQEVLGYSEHQEVGPSAKPPETIDVRFADGKRIKVPWGTLGLPGLGEGADVSMGYDNAKRQFIVSGKCEKRYVSLMDAVMEMTQRFLAGDSIYRGKAISLDKDLQPEFLNLSTVDTVPMYLTPTAQYNIQPIIARLTKTERCLANGVDLKFGALLAGDYGTGKTLLAFKLGQMAIQNDWTFIYLTAPERTAEMIQIANQLCGSGRGVLTFVEDIDLVMKGDRDAKMNEILNLMDGGNTKGSPIISVFTTNHLEVIDPTFLRGKRTGTIIQLTHLDKATAVQFIKGALGDRLVGECEIAADMVEKLQIVPSFLAEIMDRVTADMVYFDGDTVQEPQIIAAIDSYKQQMAIAKSKHKGESDLDIFQRLYNKFMIQPGAFAALEQAELA